MPTFAYVARDGQGKIQEGTAEAENAQALTRNLRERGLWVQKIEKAARTAQPKGKKQPAAATAGVTSTPRRKKRFGKVKGKDLTMFCRQFSTMINAGVSMVRCLAVLEQQAGSPNLKPSFVKSTTASRAVKRSPVRSPSFHASSTTCLSGWCAPGKSAVCSTKRWTALATFLEEDLKLKRKVKSAMTYPVIVMIVAMRHRDRVW